MNKIVLKTEFPDVHLFKRGKVRDIYDLGEFLLIVATDRLSAFDVVLPNGIPGKGKVLTQISNFWFKQMEDIIENHVVVVDIKDFPPSLHKYSNILFERSMIVKKTDPLPVECVVRGYLSGSGWKEYKNGGNICGISLPPGLIESSRLEEPIFTPSTKTEDGHDINITFDKVIEMVGPEIAGKIRDVSMRIYSKARIIAEKKGIIIADTKFEFGLYDGRLILIDELLTPDSSRFWSMKDYAPGKIQENFDKQIVRDYLLTLDWNKTYPAPVLPDDVVVKTAERYNQILKILTGV
ncbi:MAG: phosphoribosylaminoimidazolesuccinocarboxamide synthase [Nitrospirae bacterium]|nr:phosphoribosylaminoimidazolesuccinocarboxamide synthase [Nitrospirota bacterium]